MSKTEFDKAMKNMPSVSELTNPLFNYEDDEQNIGIFISKSGWLMIKLGKKSIVTKLNLKLFF